jgi:hypothetical protein
MKISALILLFGLLISLPTFAETKSNLRLSGVIYSISSTKINKFAKGPAHIQWLIEHTRNSHNAYNEKIEIEGDGQEGVKGKITVLSDEGNLIRHEILLDLIAFDRAAGKPVILKFSAN